MSLPEYDKLNHKKFATEAAAAGYQVIHYSGRNGYEGPAIKVDDPAEGHRATRVPCHQDKLGKRYVIYPR